MHPSTSPTTRRVTTALSASLLALTVPWSAAAQDESQSPATDTGSTPAADASEAPAVEAAAAKPGKLKSASLPKGKRGQSLGGVLAGGPGYIAVGGGSDDGLDPEALILVSDDGTHWQSVPLFGAAAQGLIEDIAATPFGYLAVGSDRLPPGSAHPTEAAVWRSDEGIVWERLPQQDGFTGSIMTDVAATPDGVVAVGCVTDLQCTTGRAWTSADGLTWDLAAELPLAQPSAVAHLGVTTVSGGVDEVIDYGTGGSVLASSPDAISWSMTEPLAEPQSGISDIATREGEFLATSSEWLLGADGPNSELLTSSDGQTWESISGGMLEGMSASAIGSSDALTVVAGVRDRVVEPAVIWSHDLETFKKGKFARKSKKDVSLNGVIVDDAGGLVLVVGALAYRPAIWVSQLK